MAGRLALISNLIIAKQYMSVKEEKGIRFKNKNKNHFWASSGFLKTTEGKMILFSAGRKMLYPVSFKLSIRAVWEAQQYTLACSSVLC